MLTQNALLQAFRTDLKTEFNEALALRAQATQDWKLFTSIETSTGERNSYGLYRDPAKPREWIGNRIATSLEAGVYNLVNRDWELSFDMRANDLKDDQRGLLLAKMRQYARAFDSFVEESVVKGLRDGAGATALCWDGVPFFNAAHPGKTGTGVTWSNYDAAGGGHAWVLLDSKAALRSMIYQEREAPTADLILGLDSEHCKITNNIMWGANARFVVGYGDPSTAYMSCEPVTEANVTAAYEAMLAYRDDENRPLNRDPDTIVFDPTLWAEFASLVLKEMRWDGTIYTNNLYYQRLKMVKNGWMTPGV